jgi:carbamoyl-phosphate synthase large subunit
MRFTCSKSTHARRERSIRVEGDGRSARQGGCTCHGRKSLTEQGVAVRRDLPYFSVKEAVFPFIKFPGADTILGPEMKSTGEVMGIGHTFSEAFLKSQAAAGQRLPSFGKVFISVRNADKPPIVEIARSLARLDFALFATRGTAAALACSRYRSDACQQGAEGRPNVVDMIKNGDFALIIIRSRIGPRRCAIPTRFAIRRSRRASPITQRSPAPGGVRGTAGRTRSSALPVAALACEPRAAASETRQKDPVT